MSGNLVFFVKITVLHKGKLLIITRVASGESEKEVGVAIEVDNYSDKIKFRGAEAEDFIETQILPYNLSRFFFIDGESIAEYRGLIQSKKENVTIRNNIEDILNYPILKKGIKDFKTIKVQYENKYLDLIKTSKKNKTLRKKTDELDYEIGLAHTRLNKAESDLIEIEEKIEKLEQEMSLYSSAEKLIIQKKNSDNKLLDYADDLRKTYSQRRLYNQDLWINILQPSLKESINEIRPKIDQYHIIKSDIVQLENNIQYKNKIIKNELECCPMCDQMPPPKSNKQKDKDLEKLKLMRDKVNKLNEDMKEGRDIKNVFDALQEFKALARMEIIVENINTINKLNGKIEEEEAQLEEINNQIGDIDEESVKEIRIKLDKFKSERESHKYKKVRNKKIIDEKNSEKSRHMRGMVHEDTEKTEKHSKNIKIIEYFEKMWENVLDEYSQQTRIDVEKIASDTFMKITNNKEGLSGIILNENFGLTVLDKERLPVQAVTPGMMQCAAISLIDSLRQLSNIVFPILFDTPGQSIDKTHRQNIVNYFWSERNIQFIIIPSSGEYEMEETEAKYNHLLARTWELDFDSSANKTKVKERLCN